MISQTQHSSNRAPDPRPARTRAAILAAIERLGRQGRELSVSLVVAEAGLSRSSFYSQFNDLGDVAVQLVRDLYAVSPDNSDAASSLTLAECAAMLLSEFAEHRYLYAAVLGSSAAVSAEWTVCEIMSEACLPSVQRQAPEDVDPKFAAWFISSGYLASLIAWLRSDAPQDVATFRAQLEGSLPAWASATA